MTETTDPTKLPGADPHTGNRKVDPVSGYDTTGHDWGGITELNTAFPKLVIWAMILTFLYSVIAWILLPAWPLGRDYTRGLLGLDQGEQAVQGYDELVAGRQNWLDRFATADFPALQSDAGLMQQAMPHARRLFEDNCAACHGVTGQGGPGYPVLADGHWLWSGDPQDVAETIRVGINSDHPDTRIAEMPPFDWMEHDDRRALSDYVAALPQGAGDPDSAAEVFFAENCASCHAMKGRAGWRSGRRR